MSTKTTVVLGVLLLLLLSLFLFGKKPPPDFEKDRLFSFDSDDIQSLTIDRALPSATPASAVRPRQKLAFDKVNGQWEMTSPLHCLVGASEFNSFLVTLSSLKADAKVDKSDAVAMGLTDPAFILDIKTKDGAHKLTLGGNTVTDQGYYALTDSSPNVVVTGQSISPLLTRAPEAWRDKVALDFQSDQVSRYQITRDHQTMTVEKDKDGHWQITQPTPLKADDTKVTDDLMQIKNISAQSFVPDVKADDPRVKAATVAVSVWTTTGGTTPLTLTVGTQDPKTHFWYAMRSPLSEVMEIPNNSLDALKKTTADLEDKHILAFDSGDVSQLAMTAGTSEVDAKKSGFDWDVTKPAGAKDDLHKISNAIGHVHDLSWSTRLSGADAKADHGFDAPQLAMVLSKDDKTKIGTFQFGKSTTDHAVYVRVAEHPEVVYEVPDTNLSFLRNIVVSLATPIASPSAMPGTSAAASPGSSARASAAPATAASGAPGKH